MRISYCGSGAVKPLYTTAAEPSRSKPSYGATFPLPLPARNHQRATCASKPMPTAPFGNSAVDVDPSAHDSQQPGSSRSSSE